MAKRSLNKDPDSESEYSSKKFKQGDYPSSSSTKKTNPPFEQPNNSFQIALSGLPRPNRTLEHVPAYTPFTVPEDMPPLPVINCEELLNAPFKHKSTTNYNRSTGKADASYERLEFIGDAHLELIASRLLVERFGYLSTGQLSQLRELLVKNETLAEYAKLYAFDKRVSAADCKGMQQNSNGKGNKGFNKILGDVFEAYVAAVVKSNGDEGFAIAEKWMTTLWAPKLLEAMQWSQFKSPDIDPITHKDTDPRNLYNPSAKADLQHRITAGPDTAKLIYEPYQKSIELKGAQIGQNRHFIAVYVQGWGYDKECLGKGEGRNKVEAGNWAATDAMYGPNKVIVDACEGKLRAFRESRKTTGANEKQNAHKI